jgi:DNA-binding Lrp family transcriptional regulator
MNLTARQKEFLCKLVDIYHEGNGPVHYADLASQLQVSKWTAYDIMNVLEKKGMVVRQYALSEEGASGRSQVLFGPTAIGEAIESDPDRDRPDDPDWEETLDRIFSAVERAPSTGCQVVVEELLRLLDSRRSQRGYWAGSMTALLLTVKNLRARMQEIPLLSEISGRVSSPKARMIALAEVIASLPRNGLSADVRKRLREFIGRHESVVESIGRTQQENLLRLLGRVMKQISEYS